MAGIIIQPEFASASKEVEVTAQTLVNQVEDQKDTVFSLRSDFLQFFLDHRPGEKFWK